MKLSMCAAALTIATVWSCTERNTPPQVGSDMTIESEVACPECSIEFEHVATIDSVFVRGAENVRRDRQGRYYVIDLFDGGLLKLFDGDGRFIRQVGRRGGGPGEYERIRNVLVAADNSIRVVDGPLSRISTFSPDGDYVGSVHAGIQGVSMSAVILPNQRIVVNAGNSDFLLQVIDATGGSVHKLAHDTTARFRQPLLSSRSLWPTSDGGLIAANDFTFQIDVYGPDMTRETSIARVGDWIPSSPPQELSDGRYDVPYTTQVKGVWQDEEGLLWVRMLVPHPAWTPRKRPTGEQLSKMMEDDRLAYSERPRVSTIIEVVDLERQRVLARSRFDHNVGNSIGGGWFAESIEDSVQEPVTRITRVHLRKVRNVP